MQGDLADDDVMLLDSGDKVELQLYTSQFVILCIPSDNHVGVCVVWSELH